LSIPFRRLPDHPADHGAFHEEAARKGLEAERRERSAIPEFLTGDVQRIRQVLFNLIGNAIKYTSKDTSASKSRCSPCAAPRDRGILHFAVYDSGEGIADDMLDTVFEPFTQADMGVSRGHGGTGIGLAIVKRLLRLMGSSLCLLSEPGVGSEFHFSLPLIPGSGKSDS
jgi:Signal transduction histidine kinase